MSGIAAAFGIGFVFAAGKPRSKRSARVPASDAAAPAPVITMPTPNPEVKPFRIRRVSPEEWMAEGYGQYTCQETFGSWPDAMAFVSERLRLRAIFKAATG